MSENGIIVSIEGLTREQALCALYNAAKTQGLGVLQYNPSHRMNEVEAGMTLCASDYVDYLEGRVIKTNFLWEPRSWTSLCMTVTTEKARLNRQ